MNDRKKIAVICQPLEVNLGMRFVDRALSLFLKRNRLLEKATVYSLEPNRSSSTEIEYKNITRNVDFNQYDCVVIWGDFIVSEHLLTKIEGKSLQKDSDFYFDLKSKILMKSFSENDLKKVIIFGQCMFVDSRNIFFNPDYIDNLKRLLKFSGLFKVRDPFSAHRAQALSSSNRNFLGLDAALLNYTLEEENIQSIKLKLDEKGVSREVGLFFGRSTRSNLQRRVLGYYLKYKHKNLSFKWIPWLTKKRGARKFFKFARTTNPVTDQDYLVEILSSKLIITDVYHLSLMSWSMGVPCICFGRAAQDFSTTLHDKKKEVFFTSNFISDFYFYLETFYKNIISGKLSNKIEEALSNQETGKIVSDSIRQIAIKNINELDSVFDDIFSNETFSK